MPSADRHSRGPGVGRGTLLVVGAIAAAIVVLVAGALRSGPGHTASASPGVTDGAGSLDLGTLPPLPSARSFGSRHARPAGAHGHP